MGLVIAVATILLPIKIMASRDSKYPFTEAEMHRGGRDYADRLRAEQAAT